MTAYDPAEWHDLFVAVSIDITRILEYEGLRSAPRCSASASF
jgi:hypothetical protein